jgi:hypothetical protein
VFKTLEPLAPPNLKPWLHKQLAQVALNLGADSTLRQTPTQRLLRDLTKTFVASEFALDLATTFVENNLFDEGQFKNVCDKLKSTFDRQKWFEVEFENDLPVRFNKLRVFNRLQQLQQWELTLSQIPQPR